MSSSGYERVKGVIRPMRLRDEHVQNCSRGREWTLWMIFAVAPLAAHLSNPDLFPGLTR